MAEEINSFLQETLSDQERENNLGENNAIVHPELPETGFDLRVPTLKELKVILAARSAVFPIGSIRDIHIFSYMSGRY